LPPVGEHVLPPAGASVLPPAGASVLPLVAPELVGAAMYQRDFAAQHFGIELLDIQQGYACVTMRVADYMINGHDICHGGMIFTLADTAFAYACNSYDLVALAAAASIEFLAPARLGDVLKAIANEQVLTGRKGVYDVVVTDQNDNTIALFRGRSQQTRGEVVARQGHSP
jgi:acyl-CoA thioesterase